MSDLGKQGGREGASYKTSAEGKTPKTGFDSAPKAEFATFNHPDGIGGTNKGAH